MYTLFVELLNVSLGRSECLSVVPTAEKWEELYKMAVKQSLVGICFAGVRRHLEISQQKGYVAAIPPKCYYQWLGTAAHIQERNIKLDKYCAEFEKKLLDGGYKSCVLKGQGVAALYGELGRLRQSGDIDTWALGKPNAIIEWARKTGTMTYYDYHHADISLYKGVEIELHYRPSLSRNLWRNARLQKWFKQEGDKHIIYKENLGFSVPDYVFNVVLTLNHNFWHLMYEGVGLRQILDLYFVLRSVGTDGRDAKQEQSDALKLIKYFHLQRFAAASMWIMKEVLGLEEQYLICQPDMKAGCFLLDEILKSGNFGKFDDRLSKRRYQSKWNLMYSWVKHNFRLVRYYPMDVLWTPLGVLRISLWRRYRLEKQTF